MGELSYRRSSRSWLDRLPLGNGRLGAMVGVHGPELRIGLNESSVWSGGVRSAEREAVGADAAAAALAEARALFDTGDPAAAEGALRVLQNSYCQAFLPVGELVIAFSGLGNAPSVERTLSLGDAVHSARQWRDGLTITSRTATSLTHDVLVHESAAAEGVLDARLSFESPLAVSARHWSPGGLSAVLIAPADVAPGHERDEPPVTWTLPGIRPVEVAVELRVETDGTVSMGTVSATDTGLTVTGARSLRFVLAIETTFTRIGAEPGDLADAVIRARAAVAASRDLFESHAAAHRALHDTVELDLGEPAHPGAPDDRIAEPGSIARNDPALLALLFEYGRYLMRASSRAGGHPATLQGVWNAELQPPWSSNYTLNINTPMNYWGAEPTGESAAHLALLELLEGLAQRGTATARDLYGARGWVAHHNTDAWAYTYPTRGNASWSHWPLGGAWLVRQFDEHRRFGAMSPEVLARFWPLARGCAEFLLDHAAIVDGRLETFPSTSPENTYRAGAGEAALTRTSAMDRGLIREVLALVTELTDAVGDPEDDVARRCAAALPLIDPPRVATGGEILEWGSAVEPVDPRHRHVSHLYEWFPGDGGGDALVAAVARTLDARGDDSTGWSLAWKLALRARLGDGAAVERLLGLVARPAAEGEHRGGLYPNLFAAHPPFQLDGNLGFVGAFAETLVQSHRPGRIDLLRGLAPSLRTGSVRGLVARPGITVDLEWAEGRPTRVALEARTPAAAGPRILAFADETRTVDVLFGSTHTFAWADALATASNRSAL